jgi:hypothetical protein
MFFVKNIHYQADRRMSHPPSPYGERYFSSPEIRMTWPKYTVW